MFNNDLETKTIYQQGMHGTERTPLEVKESAYVLGFLLDGSHWIPRFWARLCDNTWATAIGRPYCFQSWKCVGNIRESAQS